MNSRVGQSVERVSPDRLLATEFVAMLCVVVRSFNPLIRTAAVKALENVTSWAWCHRAIPHNWSHSLRWLEGCQRNSARYLEFHSGWRQTALSALRFAVRRIAVARRCVRFDGGPRSAAPSLRVAPGVSQIRRGSPHCGAASKELGTDRVEGKIQPKDLLLHYRLPKFASPALASNMSRNLGEVHLDLIFARYPNPHCGAFATSFAFPQQGVPRLPI